MAQISPAPVATHNVALMDPSGTRATDVRAKSADHALRSTPDHTEMVQATRARVIDLVTLAETYYVRARSAADAQRSRTDYTADWHEVTERQWERADGSQF